MKLFTDEDAFKLGRNILETFEQGLNGKPWFGRTITIPFTFPLPPVGKSIMYPHDGAWNSSVELGLPYFIRYNGPYGDMEFITLDEWLKEIK